MKVNPNDVDDLDGSALDDAGLNDPNASRIPDLSETAGQIALPSVESRGRVKIFRPPYSGSGHISRGASGYSTLFCRNGRKTIRLVTGRNLLYLSLCSLAGV
jgi:hypothetical protein